MDRTPVSPERAIIISFVLHNIMKNSMNVSQMSHCLLLGFSLASKLLFIIVFIVFLGCNWGANKVYYNEF